MSIPVRVAETVLEAAREEAELSDRSVPSQLEHWAKIGIAVEKVLGRELALRLKSRGLAASIEEALSLASSPAGQEQVAKWLAGKEVRYGADPKRKGGVIRIAADGTRTRGRMVKGQFVALEKQDD